MTFSLRHREVVKYHLEPGRKITTSNTGLRSPGVVAKRTPEIGGGEPGGAGREALKGSRGKGKKRWRGSPSDYLVMGTWTPHFLLPS